tara:strand:- start:4144 stop:4959 length:816 start_codon:yes stop_codon:yes gene_type:complete
MNFITTITNKLSGNEQRLKEIAFCTEENLKHPECDKLVILYEHIADCDPLPDDFNNFIRNHEKVEIVDIKDRPTYESVFEFCNQYPNELWVLYNADVYYPASNADSFSELHNLDFDKVFVILTRYNIVSNLPKRTLWLLGKHKNCWGKRINYDNELLQLQDKVGSSVDTWIFKTPVDTTRTNNSGPADNFNIELGLPMCDTYMNKQLVKRYKVINPSLSIISIHKHRGWTPESYKEITWRGSVFSWGDWRKHWKQRGRVGCEVWPIDLKDA